MVATKTLSTCPWFEQEEGKHKGQKRCVPVPSDPFTGFPKVATWGSVHFSSARASEMRPSLPWIKFGSNGKTGGDIQQAASSCSFSWWSSASNLVGSRPWYQELGAQASFKWPALDTRGMRLPLFLLLGHASFPLWVQTLNSSENRGKVVLYLCLVSVSLCVWSWRSVG